MQCVTFVLAGLYLVFNCNIKRKHMSAHGISCIKFLVCIIHIHKKDQLQRNHCNKKEGSSNIDTSIRIDANTEHVGVYSPKCSNIVSRTRTVHQMEFFFLISSTNQKNLPLTCNTVKESGIGLRTNQHQPSCFLMACEGGRWVGIWQEGNFLSHSTVGRREFFLNPLLFGKAEKWSYRLTVSGECIKLLLGQSYEFKSCLLHNKYAVGILQRIIVSHL